MEEEQKKDIINRMINIRKQIEENMSELGFDLNKDNNVRILCFNILGLNTHLIQDRKKSQDNIIFLKDVIKLIEQENE